MGIAANARKRRRRIGRFRRLQCPRPPRPHRLSDMRHRRRETRFLMPLLHPRPLGQPFGLSPLFDHRRDPTVGDRTDRDDPWKPWRACQSQPGRAPGVSEHPPRRGVARTAAPVPGAGRGSSASKRPAAPASRTKWHGEISIAHVLMRPVRAGMSSGRGAARSGLSPRDHRCAAAANPRPEGAAADASSGGRSARLRIKPGWCCVRAIALHQLHGRLHARRHVPPAEKRRQDRVRGLPLP
jgi:hypothetical protein